MSTILSVEHVGVRDAAHEIIGMQDAAFGMLPVRPHFQIERLVPPGVIQRLEERHELAFRKGNAGFLHQQSW